MDIADPFAVADALLQHIRIRVDHRDRRFQLVARVRDELLLFFIALRDRTDDPAGQQHHKDQHQHKSAECDPDAGPQKAAVGGDLALAVQKDPACAVVAIDAHKAVIL